MTKQLRSKHLIAWIVLAVLLPAGILSAWLVRPSKPVANLPEVKPAVMLPVVMDSISTPRYIARIRCSQNQQSCQLEYINRIPLQLPSALLYRIKPGVKEIDGHELLGRIGATGSYYFSLEKQQEEAFILYDFIHRHIVDTIKF